MSLGFDGAVAALAGATLGSLTTLAVQWRVGRIELAKLEHASEERSRESAAIAFRDFLAASKPVERLAELRWEGRPEPNDEIHTATTQMWLAHAQVSVFCEGDVDSAALQFVNAVSDLAWHERGQPPHVLLLAPRQALLDAARRSFNPKR